MHQLKKIVRPSPANSNIPKKKEKKKNKGLLHKLVQMFLVFVLALVISILSLHQGPAGLSFLLSQVVQMFQVVVVAKGIHNVDTRKSHRPRLPDSPLFQIPDVVKSVMCKRFAF